MNYNIKIIICKTATTISIDTYNFSGSLADYDFNIIVQRQGSDVKTAGFLAAVPVERVAYIKDVKAHNTPGGTATLGSYETRDLNTVEGDTDIWSCKF